MDIVTRQAQILRVQTHNPYPEMNEAFQEKLNAESRHFIVAHIQGDPHSERLRQRNSLNKNCDSMILTFVSSELKQWSVNLS
jgi:DNA-binding LacI/PurR family transcriptional regulator